MTSVLFEWMKRHAAGSEAHLVACAIDIMAADIMRNAPKLYETGDPVLELPAMAATVEDLYRRGRLAEARARATTAHYYVDLYLPSAEEAQKAKRQVARRMQAISLYVR